jgi:hypothetical protein
MLEDTSGVFFEQGSYIITIKKYSVCTVKLYHVVDNDLILDYSSTCHSFEEALTLKDQLFDNYR